MSKDYIVVLRGEKGGEIFEMKTGLTIIVSDNWNAVDRMWQTLVDEGNTVWVDDSELPYHKR